MMMEPRYLLLFGDQTVESYTAIKQLAHNSKDSPSLQTFFRKTTDVLQSQIAKLHTFERERFSSFNSIVGLAEAQARSGVNDVVVSTVLLCVAQLATLIIRAEDDERILESTPSSSVHVLGLCTGLLAAAAAVAARSAGELLNIAPEIVSVSLRLALEASHRSEQLEKSKESWAFLVRGIPAIDQQKALDDFHKNHAIPTCKYAYISAESDSSTTISGPPSTLSLLFSSSSIFSNAPRASLPISAAFHARHLGKPDVDRIVGSSSIHDMKLTKAAPIISTGSGAPFIADTLRILLHQVIVDALQIPLYWTKTVQAVISGLGKSEVTLVACGPTTVTKSLRRTLETEGIKVTEVSEGDSSRPQIPRGYSGDIAIVGMSGRFPGGDNLNEFWKVLAKGRDLHTKIPKDRFDVETHCDPSGAIKNTVLTPFGCFIDHPGLFDARLFNMSPREATQTDPMQRLIMMTTYEALEMAGYSPGGTLSTDGRRIGTFFGQTTDDWREVQMGQNIDLYYVSGGIRAFGPGRLNYHFKWEGPSYSLDTACSSSSACIEMACASLLARDCDTAVAGGGTLLTGSDMYAGLSRGGFLSPTGSCKTFDDDADGYCRGDGVGSIVLKRLEDAISDRDNILGVIKSVATNHSAHAVSITHPHAGTQERLYRRVLEKACVEPNEIEYVEMHGTGTQAGDTTEIESVTNVFGQGRKKDNPLYVGAVKANVGHGEAAAGVTSLIKIMLMLQKNVIPPHAGIKSRINHKFPPLDRMNVHIADSQVEFKAHPGGDGRRKIMLNNFNATGGNTSMLLEEGPQRIIEGKDPRSSHVIAISARTAVSLKRNKLRLLEYLNANPQTPIADLSYTTTARRMHHVFRTAHAAPSMKDLIGMITQDVAGSNEPVRTTGKPPVVFTFTGQGSRYSGMGKQLFETCTSFRESILEFEAICERQGLPSFLQIITNSSLDINSMTPTQTQLAIVSLELALAIFWQSCGLKPDMVIGHSLGEYPALCVAGVLSVSDMLYLVGKRAEMMQETCTANTHSMLAVNSPVEVVQQVLVAEQYLSCGIACVNSPTSTVVSGTIEDIKALKDRLQIDSVKATTLEVPFAFHSAQMDPVLNDFEAVAHSVRFAKPIVPVASTLRGEVVKTEGIFSANYLARQARLKVDFLGALQACKAEGLIDDRTLWVENGPAPICLSLIRATLDISPAKSLPSLRPNEDCWKLLSKGISNAYNAGADIMWPDYHKEYENALNLLDLPTYAFDLKDYWIQYEGDWLLKKNEQVSVSSSPAFSTTCLQRVESETYGKDKSSVTFVSHAAEPKLYAAIQGHLVNGVGLCPSSVYADMAFTAASYVHSKTEPSVPIPAMDVANMEVFRPLVVLPNNPNQLIKVSAMKSVGADSTEIHFSSQDGTDIQEHAHCTVYYGNGNEWKVEWDRNAYLIKSRVEGLVDSSKVGLTHRILRKMVYKLFATIVVYDEKYQGLKEVFMDSTLHEAAANIKFQANAVDGTFTFSPYWIDTIAHLAGFVLNGSVTTPEGVVYISHGFKSLRIAAGLSEDKSYSGYVRMQPTGGRGVWIGDVYLFEGNEIVAVCSGLKFQEIKKTVLHALLPGSSKVSVQAQEMPTRHVNAIKENQAVPRSSLKIKNASKPSKQARRIQSPAPTSQRRFAKILETIASEVKLDVSEFVDDANFADLGIDSLLTISIMSLLRTQTALDLPISIFSSYPTVAELRAFFQDQYGSQDTPDLSDTSGSDSGLEMNTRSRPTESSVTSMSSAASTDSTDVADIFISAVASETGIDVGEIEPSTLFTDLGVDSLMSIAVLSAVKDQTGRMLPASFFNDHPTVADVRNALQNSSEVPVFSPTTKLVVSNQKYTKKAASPKYSSNPVFLQGRPTSGLPAFFLIADGAGSAASYISLPTFHPPLPTYALESPFLHAPLEYNLSFEAVATIYVDQIRNIQPHGPYILGGWSLGGIHAYEVARQLIDLGEEIKGIVMVDSPCPKALPHMPEPTVELMEATGVFIGIKRAGKPDAPMPLTTKQHLVSCVKALKVYEAVPMKVGHRPGHTFMIWAKDGVFERVSDGIKQTSEAADIQLVEELEPAQEQAAKDENVGLRKDWLTSTRKSFGPNGWDRLVGDMECVAIDGDHFSIMNQPKIKVTGGLIQHALTKFLE